MKLIKAHVTNYRSIEDSNTFEVGDLTCLVGKNEAGKTGILSALRGMCPFDTFVYDKINDYPRRHLNKYDERHKSTGGKSLVARCWWRLDEADTHAARKLFGPKCITTDTFNTSHGFGYDRWIWDLDIDHGACLKHLIQTQGLDEIEKEALKMATDCATAIAAIKALPQQSEKLATLLKQLESYKHGFWGAITGPLESPKFFYTSHFDRMSGKVALTKLAQDRQNNKISAGDKIFLDFLEYAGTTIEELQSTEKSEELKAKLEAASNDITEEIFNFWSQNDALSIQIDIGEGKPKDEPPFNCRSAVLASSGSSRSWHSSNSFRRRRAMPFYCWMSRV